MKAYQDLSQRTMLATWLIEFYLSKCNELDDLVASGSVSQDVANLQAERTILEEDLRHFLETYKVRSCGLSPLLPTLTFRQDKS